MTASQAQTARRNTVVLAIAQAINGSPAPIIISLGGLAGASLLAADKSLATLPVTSFNVGMALGAIPAALSMRKIGRKAGFIAGALVGITGLLLAATALVIQQFAPFCLAILLCGAAAAYVQQYRFAAADDCPERLRPKAISWVMLGGIGAAIIGPQTAIFSRDLLAPTPYAGAFVAAAGLVLVGIGVLTQLRFTRPMGRPTSTRGARPLGAIIRQPRFLVAVACAIGAYAMMALVMTGAPVAMVHHGHSHDHAMLGIQWHVLAMFAPSFVTGHLILRFGKARVIATGMVLLALSAMTGLLGVGLWNFWLALILLGVGWNFGFVGATAMLTETYAENERNKVQGINDFLVFGSVAAASLFSGRTLHAYGWDVLNWLLFPVVALCLAALALSIRIPRYSG